VTKLYFGGMARHLAGLRQVLRPGAQLAYVVGDQASYLRVMIRTGHILGDIAESLGYKVEAIDLFRTRLATATGEQLREEVLVLGNAGDLPGNAAGLTVQAYDGIILDQPMYIEADLAICPNSSAGGVNIAIHTINFEPGSWMSTCGPTLFSAKTQVSCSDFLWAGQMEDQFETPSQIVEPGTWHRLRIEADPATLTIRYFIDGAAAGSHSLTNAEKFTAAQFLATRFQFALGMWKLSIDSPLLGLVDNVRIGLIAP